MAGSRLYSRETPLVRRLPELTEDHYYREGQIIFSRQKDGVNADLYVSIRSETFNFDSESLFHDSDGNVFSETWVHWASSRLLEGELGFASMNQACRRLLEHFDSDIQVLDSDIQWVRDALPLLPDSEAIDSDLRVARIDIAAINTHKIMDFVDSDAVDENIIVWDSDIQMYVTKRRVLKVNLQTPDASGNIVPSLLKVTAGTKDERPDSDTPAAIYVLQNDSDSETNGSAFIFTNGVWEPFINPERATLDLRYLKIDGTSRLPGALYVVDESDGVLTAVTKAYVDEYVKNSKQDKFYFTDSEFSPNPTDSENFVINTGDNTVAFFDGINTSRIGESVYDYPLFVSASQVGTDLTIVTEEFSPAIPGKLTITEDGLPANYTFTTNATAASISSGVATDFALVDGATQSFVITFGTFDNTKEYVITLNTHQGEVFTITKLANNSNWVVTQFTNDYGTY